MKQLLQKLGIMVSFAAAVFFPVARPVFAATSNCCLYQPNTAAPQWLNDLGASANVVTKLPASGKCDAPSEVVSISALKEFYTGDVLTNDAATCSSASGNEVKLSQASNAPIQCCMLQSSDSKTVACVPKKAGDGATSCLTATVSQIKSGMSIVQTTNTCDSQVPCQNLTLAQTAQTLNSGAQNPAPAAGAAADGANAPTPPWTKTDCLLEKDAGGATHNMWLPPANDATATTGNYCYVKPIPVNLEIPFGGQISTATGLPQYINAAYKYAIGIAVMAAVLMFMYGGFLWMFSGVSSQISQAKTVMLTSITGLTLVFGAYIILNTIDPSLINLQAPPIHAIRPDVLVTADKLATCDPSAENSCGPSKYCEPTMTGVENACNRQMMAFGGAVFGSAAIAAAAPFALAAGATALANAGEKIAADGMGLIIKNAAKSAAVNYFKGQAVETVGSKITDAIGPAVFVTLGLAYVNYEMAPKDVEGYCVDLNHDKIVGQICAGDADCQSNKCLQTSKSSCSTVKRGICVNGDLRDPCPIEVTEQTKKYACLNGVTCVDNEHGSSRFGIGFCSDGSHLGMPCNDKVACKSFADGLNLMCAGGYCRQKEYYEKDGTLTDVAGGNPRCIIPSDCTGDDYTKLNASQHLGQALASGRTTYAGCLKKGDPESGLPARFLVPVMNYEVRAAYLAELSSSGICTTAAPFFVNAAGKKTANVCYVNIYQSKKTASPPAKAEAENKTVLDAISAKYGANSMGSDFAAGIVFNKVGCGIDKDQINHAVINGTPIFDTSGDCVIDAGSVLSQNLALVNGVGVVRGYCSDQVGGKNGESYVWTQTELGQYLMYVHADDANSGWVKTPDLTNLSNTYAGTVTQ